MTAGARRILVVEDDTFLRRVVELSLTAHGYQVDQAGTGADALRLITAGPDLVVLDLGLPDVDGIDLIVGLHDLVGAPILVVSARDRRTTAATALAAGASGYLTKPFSTGELLAEVSALVAGGDPVAGGGRDGGSEATGSCSRDRRPAR